MRVAAIQLDVAIADIEANLARCEQLIAAAVADGAELVALPEFFTTGCVFDARLADAALAPDGAATHFLTSLAQEHRVHLGGSFLCRDPDGQVRNAYLLAAPTGQVLGRHDKDLPTMWENAFYVGGDRNDDGVIEADGFMAGAAVCWEFMRSGTARRLRERVDVVVGGSNWWTIPAWPPRAITRRWAAANETNARRAPIAFAPLVGAPVVHANMCGPIECPMPAFPGTTYRGHFAGGAVIADADGAVLTARPTADGPGHVVADVEVRGVAPLRQVPDEYWLHRRGPMPVYAWSVERAVGRRWYARHVQGRPPATVEWRERAAAG
jgi:predicted amidohydrolase